MKACWGLGFSEAELSCLLGCSDDPVAQEAAPTTTEITIFMSFGEHQTLNPHKHKTLGDDAGLGDRGGIEMQRRIGLRACGVSAVFALWSAANAIGTRYATRIWKPCNPEPQILACAVTEPKDQSQHTRCLLQASTPKTDSYEVKARSTVSAQSKHRQCRLFCPKPFCLRLFVLFRLGAALFLFLAALSLLPWGIRILQAAKGDRRRPRILQGNF